MYWSRRFWIPVAISLVFLILQMLWMLMLMAVGGAHGKNTPSPSAVFWLPYMHLILGIPGPGGDSNLGGPASSGFGSLVGILLFLLIFFGQFPLYGFILGWANYREKLKWTLLGIGVTHLLAYAVALKIGVQPML